MRKAIILFVTLASSVACGGLFEGRNSDDGEESAAQLTLVGGIDSLPVLPGQVLNAVTVHAHDGNFNFEGLEIHWRVIAGDGTISDSVTISDPLGRSTIAWTVGSSGLQRIEARAELEAGDEIQATMTALIGRLQIISGDSQQVGADSPTLAPLRVRWLDSNGDPVPVQYVHWRTDIDNLTVPLQTYTLPSGDSENQVTFPAGALGRPGHVTAYMLRNLADSVRFRVLIPHRLRLVQGGNQLGPVHTALPAPIVVAFDNPGNGEAGPPTPFRWEVVSGGGSLLHSHIVSSRANPMENVWTLGSTVGAQSIRILQADGAGRDTIVVTAMASGAAASGCGGNGALHEANGIPIATAETWTAAASPHIVRGLLEFGATAPLVIEAGAFVCLEPGATIRLGHSLRAIGTPANPIRFSAADTALGWGNLVIAGAATSYSEISNARFAHGYTTILAHSPIRVDSTIIRQSRNIGLMIDNPGTTSRVIHTTVDTVRHASNPAVILTARSTLFSGTVRGAAGLSALLVNAEDVTLQGCVITGNAAIGVTTNMAGLRLASCNLTVNAGLAVSAGGGAQIDARSNWWGTPAGPALGGTNGVSSGVDATLPRIGEIDVGYRPTW